MYSFCFKRLNIGVLSKNSYNGFYFNCINNKDELIAALCARQVLSMASFVAGKTRKILQSVLSADKGGGVINNCGIKNAPTDKLGCRTDKLV